MLESIFVITLFGYTFSSDEIAILSAIFAFLSAVASFLHWRNSKKILELEVEKNKPKSKIQFVDFPNSLDLANAFRLGENPSFNLKNAGTTDIKLEHVYVSDLDIRDSIGRAITITFLNKEKVLLPPGGTYSFSLPIHKLPRGKNLVTIIAYSSSDSDFSNYFEIEKRFYTPYT